MTGVGRVGGPIETAHAEKLGNNPDGGAPAKDVPREK